MQTISQMMPMSTLSTVELPIKVKGKRAAPIRQVSARTGLMTENVSSNTKICSGVNSGLCAPCVKITETIYMILLEKE